MGMSIASELNQLLAQKAAFYGEHFKAIESLEQLPQEAISLNSVLSQAHYPALLQQFALSYQAKVSTTCATKPEIDARALHSMWSQWFFGLQLPPCCCGCLPVSPAAHLTAPLRLQLAVATGTLNLLITAGRKPSICCLMQMSAIRLPPGNLPVGKAYSSSCSFPLSSAWQSWALCHQSCISAIKPILCIGIWVSCHCPSVGDNN